MQGIAELPEGVNHFGMLARRYSEDRSSRYQGGVIGWLEKDPNHPYKWGNEVLQVLWQLENEGDVSEPVVVEDKIYLVRLVERKDKQYSDYERVSAGIRQLLTRQRREQVKDEFLADIQNAVPVELNRLALEAMGPVSGPKTDREARPPAVPGTGRP
jgi:parvulin-like peptidyl-prolyl isomerase